jgi:flagellar biosynthesis component FlhA
MTDRRTDPSLQDLHRGLLIGAAVMFAIGSLAGMAGFALAGVAVLSAGRRWVHRAELTPQQLAKLKWEQAKAAAGAGAGAWRDTEQTTTSLSREGSAT